MSVLWRGLDCGAEFGGKKRLRSEGRECWAKRWKGRPGIRVREPTILFSSEQYGVAQGAVAHLRECQHLQRIHCIFLKTPEQHRCTSLAVGHLGDRGHVWVLLIVHHLYRDTDVSHQHLNKQSQHSLWCFITTFSQSWWSCECSSVLTLISILFLVILDDTTAPRIPLISFKHS